MCPRRLRPDVRGLTDYVAPALNCRTLLFFVVILPSGGTVHLIRADAGATLDTPIQKVFAYCMKLDVAHLSKFSIDSVWGIDTPAKLPSVPFALRRVQIAIERFARLEVHVYCILQFGCHSGGS